MQSLGRPTLVGTRSIEVSERLSERLKTERLQLLRAAAPARGRAAADRQRLSDEQSARAGAAPCRGGWATIERELRHLETAVAKIRPQRDPHRPARGVAADRAAPGSRAVDSWRRSRACSPSSTARTVMSAGARSGESPRSSAISRWKRCRLGAPAALLRACGRRSGCHEAGRTRGAWPTLIGLDGARARTPRRGARPRHSAPRVERQVPRDGSPHHRPGRPLRRR